MIKVAMLVGKGESSQIVYNELKKHYNIVGVIEENKLPPWQMIKRRIHRLGLWAVIGQLIFLVYLKILKKTSKMRINHIKTSNNLSTYSYDPNSYFKVNSVNDSCVISELIKLEPDVIVVNGTRIIQENILSAISAPFINTHTGITPRYRGIYGGYWALAENNIQQCGVTVHLVDKGIDTGGILYQELIKVTHHDNVLTYPYLQIAAALPILRKAIEDIYTGRYHVIHNSSPSKLYSHPTILCYLKNFLVRKVK